MPPKKRPPSVKQTPKKTPKKAPKAAAKADRINFSPVRGQSNLNVFFGRKRLAASASDGAPLAGVVRKRDAITTQARKRPAAHVAGPESKRWRRGTVGGDASQAKCCKSNDSDDMATTVCKLLLSKLTGEQMESLRSMLDSMTQLTLYLYARALAWTTLRHTF